MSSNETLHSHPLDSSNNHASLLNVVGWFLTVATFLIVLTRLATKRAVSHAYSLDDGSILVSLVWKPFLVGNDDLLSLFVSCSLSAK